MRINESTVLVNDKVVLVPYRRHHVSKYHGWMQDASVLESTASERLTLEQEYEMQASWRIDSDSATPTFATWLVFTIGLLIQIDETPELTFIILRRDDDVSVDDEDFVAKHDDDQHMVGDVNVFISSEDDEDHDERQGDDASTSKDQRRAEVEIMIASPSDRRHGYATSTLQLFLAYVSKTLSLSPDRFFARIGASNEGSIRLFEKLGFKKGKFVQVFDEQQMDWGGGDGRGEGLGWSAEYVQLFSEAEPLEAPEEGQGSSD
ncbi:hypothetical protein ACM66B_000674 [Microbotryomycetes sp. NB124-2]